jgi:2OG-Fe(II) oxygenase superfamily
MLLPMISWSIVALSQPGLSLSLSPVRQFYLTFNDAVDERVQTSLAAKQQTIRSENNLVLPVIPSKDLLQGTWQWHANMLCSASLVRLDDQETRVMERMWRVIQSIPFSRQQDRTISSMIRHQQLTHSNATNNNNNGYDYLHYPPTDEETQALVQMIGEQGVQSIQKAYELIAKVGTHFSASASVDCNSSCERSDKGYGFWLALLNKLLGAGFSGSFQRVACYRATPEESLRPHCDWSFVTVVPVSSVSGLEVYHSSHGWIRPEDVAKQLNTNSRSQQHEENAWNAGYLLVMPGKWLEILTNGQVQSSIHRVQGNPIEPRLSAPLFLRLKPEVLEEAENLVLDDSSDIASSQAMLSDFLVRY